MAPPLVHPHLSSHLWGLLALVGLCNEGGSKQDLLPMLLLAWNWPGKPLRKGAPLHCGTLLIVWDGPTLWGKKKIQILTLMQLSSHRHTNNFSSDFFSPLKLQ